MGKGKIIKGTFILAIAGIITRIIGFYYRIFLSKTIGAEGIGLYQMIFPIYGLCFALSVSGIQTAISKYVAAKNATGDTNGMMDTLKTGLSISLVMSFASAIVLYFTSGFIAGDILNDIRCQKLLQIAAFSVPLGALHSCIGSYYLGRQKAFIPGFSQLMEQVIRVFSVYVIWTVLVSSNTLSTDSLITPAIAVVGLIIGEAASCTISLIAIFMEKDFKVFKKIKEKKKLHNGMVSMAYPITLNRVIGSLMSSVEAILIPLFLQKYGMDNKSAISLYGILTGMAMPFIFFPSTITGSISSMLLPSISEAEACGKTGTIKFATEKTIKYCLSIGIFCTGFFVTFGKELGLCIFNNETAGIYITILGWLCPFLYLCVTLASILNGLGHTKRTFRNNMVATIIRLLFIIIIIPEYGIKGYLLGLLCSEIACSLLHILYLRKNCHIDYSFTEYLFKPMVFELLSLGVSMFTYKSLQMNFNLNNLLNLAISAITGGFIYFLYLIGTQNSRKTK